jgi:quercetin dioxygenase-like cupin family protein
MPFLHLDDTASREVAPGCHARFVHTEHVTISYWNLDEGAVLRDHSHPHEQICTVIDGELQLTVGGETQLMTRGQVAVIPGGTAHEAKALTACFVQDVFWPVRDDYR